MPSTPSSRARSALNDIKDNIELARIFIAELDLETFREDRKSVYAVIRCLEIISEASRRLPAELKHRHPDIPWNSVAAAGSVYRHGYELVRDDVLWVTVRESLQPLLTVVDQELAQLSST